MSQSKADIFRALPPAKQKAFLSSLTDQEAALLNYDWTFWSRPE
jgi:hypothetical protein